MYFQMDEVLNMIVNNSFKKNMIVNHEIGINIRLVSYNLPNKD